MKACTNGLEWGYFNVFMDVLLTTRHVSVFEYLKCRDGRCETGHKTHCFIDIEFFSKLHPELDLKARLMVMI